MAIDYEKDLFECAKCRWIGKHSEKLTKQNPKTLYTNIVCPKCSCEEFYLVREEKQIKEEAILTFTKTAKDEFQLTASFYPVPKNMQQVECATHEHALAIVHIFSVNPELMFQMANYLAEGGDINKLSHFLTTKGGIAEND